MPVTNRPDADDDTWFPEMMDYWDKLKAMTEDEFLAECQRLRAKHQRVPFGQ